MDVLTQTPCIHCKLTATAHALHQQIYNTGGLLFVVCIVCCLQIVKYEDNCYYYLFERGFVPFSPVFIQFFFHLKITVVDSDYVTDTIDYNQ